MVLNSNTDQLEARYNIWARYMNGASIWAKYKKEQLRDCYKTISKLQKMYLHTKKTFNRVAEHLINEQKIS